MNDETVTKLLQTLEQIRGCADRSRQQPLWREAFNLLKKLPVDQNRAANIVAGRNVTALATLVAELRAAMQEADAAAEPGAVPDSVHIASARDVTDEETLKAAMKLFRRRFKFAKLDEESKLGRSPIGGGHRLQGFAIEAPGDYPRIVWDELVRRGQLRYTGEGFYQLAED